MDMQLPDMSGPELTNKITAHEELGAIPVIAVTAFAASEDEKLMREAGCCGFVCKPFDFAKFLKTVSDILG
jgi:two-component system, cell cycle response regulator DivK